MSDLMAQGPKPEYRWRRKLAPGQTVVVGRSAGRWSVPWDDRISRRHAELVLTQGKLQVQRLSEALNPVFFHGREADRFELECGDHFVIGSTSFSMVDAQVALTLDAPVPIAEKTIAIEALQRLPFRDVDRRMDTLVRLPELLAAATNDDEQAATFVGALLHGIPAATFIALVEVDSDEDEISIRQWDQRQAVAQAIEPSERLIRQALSSGASVIHVWSAEASEEARFTEYEGADWAFCLPMEDQRAGRWGVYVAGAAQEGAARPSPDVLQEEVKFVDLAARLFGHVRRIRRFEREQSSLRQFISPIVIDAIMDEDPETVLQPREADVSVLFCDLRGFSRRSELQANDLMELLNRVSGALGVMTREILTSGGVIGDFHGDAAMGFWGWPLDQPDAALQACRAALRIRREFLLAAKSTTHPLADFRMGIGIATGTAVAGKIGTVDQVKVTVFGPVVNLASRLESMTKVLRAPILIDEATVKKVRSDLPAEVARLRRVARLRPPGLEQAVEVSELLPPAAAFPEMPDDGIVAYERALDALVAGNWEEAFSLLHHVPAEDRVKDFLTVFIAQNNRTPPENWDGVIALPERM